MSTYEYRKDAHENFWDENEVKEAVKNKDLKPMAGGYYDPETGIEYYEDGTKRG